MIENIKKIINESFKDLVFNEKYHTYTVKGKKISKSVTALAGEYSTTKPFDTNYWAERKAKERGITKEEIIKEWDDKRDFSALKGTNFHKFMEGLFLGEQVISDNKDTQMGLKFYHTTKPFLVPIASEYKIYDIELDIAGTIDQLFYCPNNNQLGIIDWKTNKNISSINKYNDKMKEPFNNYDNCELNNYSLQLGIYKYIIEKNTDLIIDFMKIIWFNSEVNDSYKIFECVDFQDKIKLILEK